MCENCDRELGPMLDDPSKLEEVISYLMPACRVVSDAITGAQVSAVNSIGIPGHPGAVCILAVVEVIARQLRAGVVSGKAAELATILSERIGSQHVLILQAPPDTQGTAMALDRLPPTAQA